MVGRASTSAFGTFRTSSDVRSMIAIRAKADIERLDEMVPRRRTLRSRGAGVASVVPGALSTAICSGLPVHLGRAHPRSYGHQITREDLRRPCSPPSSLAAFWYGASTVGPVDISPRTSLVGRFREG